jgi:pimeloyl-ACP methyl ester carboxylesterase
MKRITCIVASLLLLQTFSFAQKRSSNAPSIIPCDCRFRMDSSYIASAPLALQADSVFPNRIDTSFKTQCGYLLVPENRAKASSKMIRLPFIIVKSKNTNKKKDPVLFTSGGPGNSSLGWAQGITRSTWINDRDCIAFEQRGTRFAIPYLRNFELDMAMREAYRKNLSKDSMTIVGLQRYKKKLLAKGIDLAGYTSDETVTDIGDLLRLLQIDSVNLLGGSYSGGLMMAVLQSNPSRVRSLVLDSPLPMFTPIDEDEPVNFHEALSILFRHVDSDSANKELYTNLGQRFSDYFTSLLGKTFYHPYLEKNTTDTILVQYTKNELIDVIVGSMLDQSRMKDVPYMITDIIKGHHAPYIQRKLDGIFNRYPAPDGMRISVYCADQASYHSQEIVQQLYKLYPYMDGYHINDVYKKMCDCWGPAAVKATTKQPFYSSVPALIADGEMDAACRPLYMRLINHYLPNGQSFLFINRGHGVGGKDFYEMVQRFLDQPYKKLVPTSKEVVAY